MVVKYNNLRLQRNEKRAQEATVLPAKLLGLQALLMRVYLLHNPIGQAQGFEAIL